ncbi:MAG: ATP-binding protein [Desulfobacteraceae bacterium]|jgi:two-component system phosphate regulon sensor histidine kinase PhoR
MDDTDKDLDFGTKDNSDTGELTFYKFIIDSLPVAVLAVNADFKITGFNPWAEKVTGYSEKEAIGHFCHEILKGGMCEVNCPLKAVLKREKPINEVETTIYNKQGDLISVRMNTAGLFDDEGYPIGGVEAFHDISRLKSMEREKDNLISMFAHDMKSSISIIGGFAFRLLKKATSLSEEKRKKYLEIIKKESGNLEFIVEDFLEFARLQTGKLRLNFASTSVDKVLMELIDAYQEKARQNGINLEFEMDEALPIMEADAERLRRVFTNLLDNAFKFSREKGEITVATQETDREIIVKIKDQGSGIDSRDLPYIFDPFHRGRGTRKEEGSGVGLAAAKEIVEGHGGRIHVESELGQGSLFIVVLPKPTKSDGTPNHIEVQKMQYFG